MEIFKEALSSEEGSVFSENLFMFFENASSHRIFKCEKPNYLEAWFKNINSNINEQAGRRLAIVQLLLLLPQCPQDKLSSHGEKWIRLCLSNWIRDEGLEQGILVITNFILKKCHEIKELHKTIQKSNFDFIPKICSMQSNFYAEICTSLTEYLKLFPSQSLPYKAKLETLSLNCLNLSFNTDDSDVVAAAKLFAAIPIPGSAESVDTAKGAQLDQLISLTHSTIDAIFINIDENEVYEINREHKLPFTTLESARELNDPIRLLITSIPMVCHSLIFIQKFLSSTTSAFICLKPRDLISVPFRILQIETKTLKKYHSAEVLHLRYFLPTLHLRALKFLRSIINQNICGLYTNLIEELLVALLQSQTDSNKISKSKAETLSKSICVIKAECYACLTDILKVTLGRQVNCLEDLIPLIISDTDPRKEKVMMRVVVRGGRLSQLNPTKKSKKKGYTLSEGLPESSSASKVQEEVPRRASVVVEALKLIESLFTLSHHSMDVKHSKKLYCQLITLSGAHKWIVCVSTKVKLAIYSSLAAYALYPNPLFPPNYANLFHIFNRGTHDYNSKVAQICHRSLASLSFIISNPSTTDWSELVKFNREQKELTESRMLNGDDEQDSMVSDKNYEKIENVKNENENVSLESQSDHKNDDNDVRSNLVNENGVFLIEDTANDLENEHEASSNDKHVRDNNELLTEEQINVEKNYENASEKSLLDLKEKIKILEIKSKKLSAKQGGKVVIRRSKRRSECDGDGSITIKKGRKDENCLTLSEMLVDFVDADPDFE